MLSLQRVRPTTQATWELGITCSKLRSLRLEGVERKRRHKGCFPIAAHLFCPEATLLSLQRVRPTAQATWELGITCSKLRSLRLEGVERKRRHKGCIPIAAHLFYPEATFLSLQRVPSTMLGASQDMPCMVLKNSWRITFIEDSPPYEAEVVGDYPRRKGAV